MPCDGRWQFHCDERVRRIEIILTGLIDDPKVALSSSRVIWENLIELPRS